MSTDLKVIRSSFEAKLVKIAPKIAEVLPKRAGDAKQFIRYAIMATVRDPKLLQCDEGSLFLALMNAAVLGLPPSGGPGTLSHLIPYGRNVQLVADYRGLMEIAYTSEKVKLIDAQAVYANDHFRAILGLKPNLEHVPTEGPRGEVKAAYAVAHMAGDCPPIFSLLWREDIDKIRAGSKAGNSGPWKDHYPEMAKKSAIRRLCKLLPRTKEMAFAEQVEAAADEGRMARPESMDWAEVVGVTIPEDDSPAPAAEENPDAKASLIKALYAEKTKDPAKFDSTRNALGISETLEKVDLVDLQELAAVLKKGGVK